MEGEEQHLGGEEQHSSSITHPDVNSRIDLFNGRAGGNFEEKKNLEEEEEQEGIISII